MARAAFYRTWSLSYAFTSFSNNFARCAASSRLTQPSPAGRPSANAYKVSDTERAISGSSNCFGVQLHSTFSTRLSSNQWIWIVMGSSLSLASSEVAEGDTTLISPCSRLMVKLREGVPGNGWPRRKKNDSVASFAARGDGCRRVLNVRRSGTLDVIWSTILFVEGSRMGTLGRWICVLAWIAARSTSPMAESIASRATNCQLDADTAIGYLTYHGQRR